MSEEKKLQDYQFPIIIGKEKKNEPILQMTLEDQKKKLVWAYLTNDQNYIYSFDDQQSKIRQEQKQIEKYFHEFCQYTLCTALISRYIITPYKQVPIQAKISCHLFIFLIPQFYLGYRVLKHYDDISNTLYEKYIKK